MKISVIRDIYRYFDFTDISVDILEKYIDKLKIDQNSWKYKKIFIEM